MSEPRTINVTDGGFVSVERPDDRDWIRLEVKAVDRTVAVGVTPTSDEAVALGRELLRVTGGPEPYG